MPSIEVRTFPGAVDSLLNNPSGDLGRELAKVGARIESKAKSNASGRPGPNIVSGDLRASIGHRVERVSGGLDLLITVGMPYGVYLEKGYTTSRGMFVHYPFLRPAIESSGSLVLGGL